MILLNNIMPTTAPHAIGKRNLILPLTSLKKFKTQFNSFSYNPKTIQITPLLIPGSIAPEPMKIPFIKFEKDFNKITWLSILSNF